MRRILYWTVIHVVLLAETSGGQTASSDEPETLSEINTRLAKETAEAYGSCPFSVLSKDYFSRFSLDPAATPAALNSPEGAPNGDR